MGIVYKKSPDCFDVDKFIVKAMKDLYRTCPFCGARWLVSVDAASAEEVKDFPISCEEKYDLTKMTLDRNTYGYPKFNWVRMNFSCHKCGMKWQSDKYPMGISTDHDFIERVMNMPIGSENVAMIFIKRKIQKMIGGQPRISPKEGFRYERI